MVLELRSIDKWGSEVAGENLNLCPLRNWPEAEIAQSKTGTKTNNETPWALPLLTDREIG